MDFGADRLGRRLRTHLTHIKLAFISFTPAAFQTQFPISAGRLGSNLRKLDRPFFAPAPGGSDGQAQRLQSVFRPGGRGASLPQRRKESLQLQAVTRLKTVGEIFVMIVARSEILRKE